MHTFSAASRVQVYSMEANAFPVVTVQPTVKWALMRDGMRKGVRISSGLLAWVVVSA